MNKFKKSLYCIENFYFLRFLNLELISFFKDTSSLIMIKDLIYVWTVHVTNFMGNHDAEQKSIVFINTCSLCWVAGRSDMSQTH